MQTSVTALTSLWAQLLHWPRPTPAPVWRWAGRQRWASWAGDLLSRRSWNQPAVAPPPSEGPGRGWTRRLACWQLQLLRRRWKPCCWVSSEAGRSEAWCHGLEALVRAAWGWTPSPGTLQTSRRRMSWALGHWWVSVECLGHSVLLCLPASSTPIQ